MQARGGVGWGGAGRGGVGRGGYLCSGRSLTMPPYHGYILVVLDSTCYFFCLLVSITRELKAQNTVRARSIEISFCDEEDEIEIML